MGILGRGSDLTCLIGLGKTTYNLRFVGGQSFLKERSQLTLLDSTQLWALNITVCTEYNPTLMHCDNFNALNMILSTEHDFTH
jgi:hypothetical protein